ncbi:MAG: hypothetical protein CMJ48_02430 [Planctomycetaceae bacterium]|nr:hypothetical protein [Planctomycetaceae bacterium]
MKSPSQRCIRLFALVSLLFGAATNSQAAVIFTNLGAGDTYGTSSSWTLSVGSPIITNWDQGAAFTTPAGPPLVLDKIELAVGTLEGANELDVWFMSDAAGLPAALLEAFHFSGAMGPLEDVNPLLSANSVVHPVLLPATQYWLIASTTGPDAWAGWNLNSIGDTGPHAYRENLAPWDVRNRARGAFRISATSTTAPVPEPNSMVLLGIGAVGLFGAHFRRRKKTSAR